VNSSIVFRAKSLLEESEKHRDDDARFQTLAEADEENLETFSKQCVANLGKSCCILTWDVENVWHLAMATEALGWLFGEGPDRELLGRGCDLEKEI